jgi:putative transposase
MRHPRRKPRHQPTDFHCTSRAVAGQFLFDELDRHQFRKLMWKHAAFCEMNILTHTILSNHFHILCRAPGPLQLTDQELLAKLQAFYGPQSPQALAFQAALKSPKTTRLQTLRRPYLARIGDLSVFMKELKQAFTRWYNTRHQRYGTLWAERFRSTVVEGVPGVVLVVAAYLDLNSVRAGLVKDPKDYRFCGYAEALARGGLAREGLASLWPPDWSWKRGVAEYRKLLFGEAGRAGHSSKKTLDRAVIKKVYEQGGKLSVAELLRMRVRYFTDGVVIGTKGYVEEFFQRYCKQYVPKRKSGARRMKGGDWGGLMSLRDLQKNVIG